MLKIGICRDCIYYREDENKKDKNGFSFEHCVAFPNGIPHHYICGDEIHDEAVESQEGEHYFYPKEEKIKDYKKNSCSFEGFEGINTKKRKEQREQEFAYKLRLPPKEMPFQDDINWVKQHIENPPDEIRFLMHSLIEERVAEIEKNILEAGYGTMHVTLWKPNDRYFLVGGYAKVVYELCQKYQLDFDVQLLHFEGGEQYSHLNRIVNTNLFGRTIFKQDVAFTPIQAVKEWVLHQYFTDPKNPERLLNQIRGYNVFYD